MSNFNINQGWQCPICKRVYSPATMMCCFCKGEYITTDSTAVNKPKTLWDAMQNGEFKDERIKKDGELVEGEK